MNLVCYVYIVVSLPTHVTAIMSLCMFHVALFFFVALVITTLKYSELAACEWSQKTLFFNVCVNEVKPCLVCVCGFFK
jgi:hypothetical protein